MKIGIRVVLVAMLALSTNLRAAELSILKQQIEKTIPRARGQVGVAIKHLESGTEVLVNADGQYPMASAFKLLRSADPSTTPVSCSFHITRAISR